MITKISPATLHDNPTILEMSTEEMTSIHRKIVSCWEQRLKSYGVKPLWQTKEDGTPKNDIMEPANINPASLDSKELQLIFLYKHRGCFVHKDVISAFVRRYKPSAGLDQQVRHLGSQYGWNVLNKGNKVPDEDVYVPSGYHYLVSLDSPNPTIVGSILKRKGRLAAESFEELKVVYDNRCATCGIKEGVIDKRYNNVTVVLEQGHMDPRKPLTIENTIPQCQYCNHTYKDYFRFNEYGRVIAVNNPEILLKSPKDIQDEMIKVLTTIKNKSSD